MPSSGRLFQTRDYRDGNESKTKENIATALVVPLSPLDFLTRLPKATAAGMTTATQQQAAHAPIPPRSANYCSGLIFFRSRDSPSSHPAMATARNKSFWMEDTPTVPQDLDLQPKSTNPLAQEATGLLLSAGSTNYVDSLA